MEIEFDPAKDRANVAKHGISLARAAELEVLAFVRVERQGESRIQALGILDGEYYSLTFVFRPNVLRAVTLRRAHRKEIEGHV
jgi:uncharacterized DUF497 family protein